MMMMMIYFGRSTDLLALPNVNPDASYGMQISIEDDLTSQSVVCFQVRWMATVHNFLEHFQCCHYRRCWGRLLSGGARVPARYSRSAAFRGRHTFGGLRCGASHPKGDGLNDRKIVHQLGRQTKLVFGSRFEGLQ